MKLVRDTKFVGFPTQGAVVTIGNFDGLHLGHQQLINQAIQLATAENLLSVVMSFSPTPRSFFDPSHCVPQLQRISEKCLFLRAMNVDYLWCLRFTAKMATMTAQQFVKQFLVDALSVKHIVIGDDFRFGAGRKGDVSLLKQLGLLYGFQVHEVAAIKDNAERISSTRIRDVLKEGDMERASQLLGRPYSIMSRVIYGDQRGREWGFPTANLSVFRPIPAVQGIFAVKVSGEDFEAKGVASIGFRPVFALKRPLLEVFILDFDRDIYGQRLVVDFLHKIRDEAHFDSVDLLIQRMHQDVAEARAYFAAH